jgi:predicted methyltransferase
VEFVKTLYAALKPGGVLGVIDHVGVAGQNNHAAPNAAAASARRAHEGRLQDRSRIQPACEPGGRSHEGVFDPAIAGTRSVYVPRA